MAKKTNIKPVGSTTGHINALIEWMSQGVYEKEHIIAAALLCAVAGENMFLLGPPGTAKSMVASRLKMVFKDGKSFDYLMSRFSTPDEIFGPISISRLKNDDKYERLTEGYLPDADIVFLDEIWKAGPSIQNSLLTAVNEHIFHNGGKIVQMPMKALIAASNELPAKDEGLEALWDRFLVRMVSNCIGSDTSFFKMIKSAGNSMSTLDENLFITNELFSKWQDESKSVDISVDVVNAIKAVRKSLAAAEKEDGNNLRYYVSDRRWRKAFRLMQTSAYLNGRSEIMLSDYLFLIYCLWNDAEAIPEIIKMVTESISTPYKNRLTKLDKSIRQVMTPAQATMPSAINNTGPTRVSNDFMEYDYFYHLVENFPDGLTYFSKWDYSTLPSDKPKDGIKYFDTRRNSYVIHSMIDGKPFENKAPSATGITKVKIQKCAGGVVVDGIPYSFRRKSGATLPVQQQDSSAYGKIMEISRELNACVSEWSDQIFRNWTTKNNIFLSQKDYDLVAGICKEVDEQIKTMQVKVTNLRNMLP